MNVPFLDLKAQYESIKEEIDDAIQQVLNSCAFAGGKFVEKFENEFSQFCNCKYAIGVGSGTEALWLSLLSLEVGPGDEVITVPNTFIATAEAISFCGATPVFVDIDPISYNMDPANLQRFLESECEYDTVSKTVINKKSKRSIKAIVPVHLYGQMAEMDKIDEIAKSYNLSIVEDAAQAHGSKHDRKSPGEFGEMATFSFYPGKNLGAYGEAGAIITNNENLANKVKMLRNHGQERKYIHKYIGCNSRMDGFQGAVLSVKLKYLNQWNENRRRVASIYYENLKELNGIGLPIESDKSYHVYHIYSIKFRERDNLIKYLENNGISCGIHYPTPIHLQDAYRFLNLNSGLYPISEEHARTSISLPMFPEMKGSDLELICEMLKIYYE